MTPEANPDSASNPAVEQSLAQFDAEYLAAFTSGNAQAMADLFTEDCSILNSFGQLLMGRAAIESSLKHAFAGPLQSAQLEITPRHHRLLSEDVALQHGTSRTTRMDEPGKFHDYQYTKILVRQSGVWRIASAQFATAESAPR